MLTYRESLSLALLAGLWAARASLAAWAAALARALAG